MLRIIENQFRQPSGILGKIVSKIMQKGYNKAYNRVIERLDIKENDNIFEIGYGHGLGFDNILTKYNCFVSGIDYSKTMRKIATKKNKKHIHSGIVELLYGDFHEYDMNPNSYDKIFCLNVIYFWDKLENPFSKIKSGLKENGLFCFYMDRPEELSRQGFMKEDLFNKYTIDQVIEKLKLSGFNKIDYQEDHMGYYIKAIP